MHDSQRITERFLIAFILASISICCAAAKGATVFTTDFTVNTGDNYVSVEAHDLAHGTVLGGLISNRLQYYDSSSGDIYSGDVNALYVQDNATANVYSGSYINTYIGTYGDGILNVFGGRMPDRWLTSTDSSVVNLYVRNYTWQPGAGQWGDGRITGTWQDTTSFLVDLEGAQTFSHIVFHNVPEPSSILLCIAGSTLVAARTWRQLRPKRAATNHR